MAESDVLFKALVACGEDFGPDKRGVYVLLETKPISVICGLLATRLNTLGYRVIESSNVTKKEKLFYGKRRNKVR